MEATLLLCDYAEEVNGKLYVMGGGWTRLLADSPAPVAVALLVEVPWDQANRPHAIKLALLTDDGEPVEIEEGKVVGLEGKLEVGRPPGTRPGSSLNAPIAIRFNGFQLPVGRYQWEFSIDGSPIVAKPFDVHSPED